VARDNGFRRKRVTVVGLGLEGIDVVRFLHSRGARITVSDAKPAEALAPRLEQIAGIPVHLSLGANDPKDIAAADIVFVSQSVPLDLPALAEARTGGVPISSMFKLFMQLCPAPCAITGNSGKSTTTALTGEMFRREGRPCFVGGNIGVGLLTHLGELSSDTWVILEVSHTQLQLLPERSPHVACVLNVTPNHLDRFTRDQYWRLKANILRGQTSDDYAVLGYDDSVASALAGIAASRVLYFSLRGDIPGDGAFLHEGWIILRWRDRQQRLFPVDSLRLRGRHNWANAAAGGRGSQSWRRESGAIIGRWRSRACHTASSSWPAPTVSTTTTTASPPRPSALWPPYTPSASRWCSCWAVATSTCPWRRWPARPATAAGPWSSSASPHRCWKKRSRGRPLPVRPTSGLSSWRHRTVRGRGGGRDWPSRETRPSLTRRTS
jgi:hypothetical protein